MQIGRDDRVEAICGFITMRIVIASTSILSQVTSGNSCATSAAISSHITIAWRCAFDLVTTVRSLRGRDRASSNAKRMIRVDAGAGQHRDVGRDLDRQPLMHAAADPGIFALRILAHDDPVELRPVTWRSGLVIPGRMRVGRTLAYWSSGWQIASRSPHSVTWSGTSGAPTAPNRIASNLRSRSAPSAGIITPCLL